MSDIEALCDNHIWEQSENGVIATCVDNAIIGKKVYWISEVEGMLCPILMAGKVRGILIEINKHVQAIIFASDGITESTIPVNDVYLTKDDAIDDWAERIRKSIVKLSEEMRNDSLGSFARREMENKTKGCN